MFVVCAHAPGRIDGVLVALVIVVLITTHSACLVMRAAQGACPIWHADGQMAGLVGAFAAAQAARESNRPLLELFRDCLEISFQADDGPRPRYGSSDAPTDGGLAEPEPWATDAPAADVAEDPWAAPASATDSEDYWYSSSDTGGSSSWGWGSSDSSDSSCGGGCGGD